MKGLKVLIVGGGIAGLAASAWLQRAGCNTVLVEKAPRLRGDGSGILLGVNAVALLSQLGLGERLASHGQVVNGVVLANRRGRRLSTVDVAAARRAHGLATIALLREALHDALLSLSDPATVQLGRAPSRIEGNGEQVIVGFTDGAEQVFDLLIGADGIHSFVRQACFGPVAIRPARQEVWRFVVEPGGASATREAVELWGRGKRLGIFPVGSGKFYCFAVQSIEADGPRGRHLRGTDLAALFGEEFTDASAQAVLRELNNETRLIYGELGDLNDTPLVAGRTVLIGDAGHATTPNMGQGAALAIEDAWTLAQVLAQAPDPGTALAQFQQRRLGRVRSFRDRAFRMGQLGHWSRSPWVELRDFLLRLAPDGPSGRSVIKSLLAYDRVEPTDTDHPSEVANVHPNPNP